MKFTLHQRIRVDEPKISKKADYSRPKVKPVNSGTNFDPNEMFFSTTDLQSAIQSGNDVFIRISQYDKEDLIGSLHNIIRHPDMPRIVFKLLWDYIETNKFIAAYVKNMAKDGRYYWVLANVFPITDANGDIVKYTSVRIKPQSEVFKLMPEVYRQVLHAEKDGGMEGGLETVLKILKSVGFDSYDAFMAHFLVEEMKVRETSVSTEAKTVKVFPQVRVMAATDKVARNLQEAYRLSAQSMGRFGILFRNLDDLLTLSGELGTKTKFIQELSEDIELLALNTFTQAAKLPVSGQTFSVIAREIQKNSDTSAQFTEEAEKHIGSTTKAMQNVAMSIVHSKLQIEQIVQFMEELLMRLEHGRPFAAEELAEQRGNCVDLLYLVSQSTEKIHTGLKELSAGTRTILKKMEMQQVVVKRLISIQTNGLIETAHTGGQARKFRVLFAQMVERVEAAKKEIDEFTEKLLTTRDECVTMMKTVEGIHRELEGVYRCIENLERLEDTFRQAV